MRKRSKTRRGTGRKYGKHAVLGVKEKRRLIQLFVCVGLFLAVFLGRGIAPAGLARSGERLLEIIRSDTDFAGAFSALGEAVSKGEPVLETLEHLAVEVFGAGAPKGESSVSEVDALAAQAARAALTEKPTGQVLLSRLGVSTPVEEPAEGPTEEPAETGEPEPDAGSEPEPASTPEPEPGPPPTPSVPEYTGPDLPEGATMDYVDLGLEDTATPVMGTVTSAYGYRDHPVSGAYHFHAGTDLSAETGTPIAAFADGTVEFIGESNAYGLYIQIDHGNGVKSFYCHCSELYFHKGQTVTKGQTIAAVGATGNATGSHLHLELRRDGVLLNPVYYIETED